MSDGGVPAPISRAAVKRKRDERVRRRVRLIRREASWLDERKFARLLQRHASLGIIFDQLCENVRRFGLVNDLGEPRAIVDSIRRLGQTLLSFDRELGLTPMSSTAARTRPIDIFEIAGSVPPIDEEVLPAAEPEEKV
ncbi:MAG: hypothetical protein WA721_14645 [Candidatus Binataceae bacterium]|jgi:hypothetical protein